MSKHVDDLVVGQHIAQANKWEEEIAHAKYNTNIQRMTLIHNIAHVSKELLEEARRLRQVHEEAK